MEDESLAIIEDILEDEDEDEDDGDVAPPMMVA